MGREGGGVYDCELGWDIFGTCVPLEVIEGFGYSCFFIDWDLEVRSTARYHEEAGTSYAVFLFAVDFRC